MAPAKVVMSGKGRMEENLQGYQCCQLSARSEATTHVNDETMSCILGTNTLAGKEMART